MGIRDVWQRQKEEAMECKKEWQTPEITVHGPVEELTQQDKKAGSTDCFIFLGQPITNNS
jgi:hypothetical protein